MLALPSVGMSILELSHRSAAFESILAQAEADVRAIAAIPANYKVLFLQGGASTQFSMVPMNLLTPGQPKPPTTSTAAPGLRKRSRRRRSRRHRQRRHASTKAEGYFAHAAAGRGAQAHARRGLRATSLTSNNTIEGTEYKTLPDVGDVPLVSATPRRTCSAARSTIAKHALIYAWARRKDHRAFAGVTGGDHPRGHADRARRSRSADDVELRRARAGGWIALQHAPHLCGLHRSASRHEVADRDEGGLAAIARSVNERKAAKPYIRRDRLARRYSTAGPRRAATPAR